MARLYKFLSLSSRERYLLFGTYSLLNIVRLGLWLLPFIRLRNALSRISHCGTDYQQLPVERITWAIDISSRYSPGHTKCLARALTTQVLMHRQGYSPELKIGVMKSTAGKFEAHAWVEQDGNVVIGKLGNLQAFTPLPRLQP